MHQFHWVAGRISSLYSAPARNFFLDPLRYVHLPRGRAQAKPLVCMHTLATALLYPAGLGTD